MHSRNIFAREPRARYEIGWNHNWYEEVYVYVWDAKRVIICVYNIRRALREIPKRERETLFLCNRKVEKN